MTLTVSLVGNPNCGKTTLFNALTGARQRVGNWPGVTVEKKVGQTKIDHQICQVVDLPGVYSLSVPTQDGSVDERIACEYLLSGDSDVVVNILDASNLERNLYLTTQLLEMQVPLVIAVNMMDIAKKRGYQLDLEKLAEMTGCQVVPLISRKGKGVAALKQAIQTAATQARDEVAAYDTPISAAVDRLVTQLDMTTLPQSVSARWLALRLLEQDQLARQLIATQASLLAEADQEVEQLKTAHPEGLDLYLADLRYQKLAEWMQEIQVVVKTKRASVTHLLDKVALNRWLGVPIFLLVMYLIFECAITLGGAFQPLFDDSSRVLFMQGFQALGISLGLPSWLTAVLSQGVGLGLNTVLTFIPQIGALFLMLSLVESSGYMARAAFVMDKLMQWVGLPGKSFVPLVIGFGCNVPGIMATRTLESRRDRLLTIFISPFMSCGARLAIFAVFSTAFFPQGGALVVFSLYLLGILIALFTGLILKLTLLKGQPAPFVMELPPYHAPNIKSVLIEAWCRLKQFLLRAGKIIIPVCVVIGTLNGIQWNGKLVEQGSPVSVLSSIGKMITPVLHPMGVTTENWPATVGLITGVLAKEVVVGTLNTLYTQGAVENEAAETPFQPLQGVKSAIQQTVNNIRDLSAASFANPFEANEAEHDISETAMGNMVKQFETPLAAYSYMLFVLLYIPCISTAAVMSKEAGRGWSWLSVMWSTIIAYAMATLVYQLGSIQQNGASSFIWSAFAIVLIAFAIIAMHRIARHLSMGAMALGCDKTKCGGCAC